MQTTTSTHTIPKVTVITVAYNPGPLLEPTIIGVLGLSYPALEYIVIDGGSEDGTQAVLARYRDRISHIVSEPDEGIYDAMNKGMQLASGDYLWFLNAGDTPGDSTVLAPLLAAQPAPDFIYGDTRLVRKDGSVVKITRSPAELDWQTMSHGMRVSHQSFLPRRGLAKAYDRKYSYIADQKWVVDILRQAALGLRLQRPMSNYLIGGVSQTRFNQCVVEKIRYSFTDLGLARA
ncbi:MAG: glycosyltransferase, partial [Burkholderiaceae bacterium]|nr:glycosyltransferase [Burkholderiaceae bacterium]